MAQILLWLVSVVLFIVHYVSSQNEVPAGAELRETPTGAEVPSVPVDPPPNIFVPPLNPDDEVDQDARGLPAVPLVAPLFSGPFETFGLVQSALFDGVVGRLRTDLEAMRQRQEVIAKFVECSGPEAGGCKAGAAAEEPPKLLRGYWEWLASVNPPAPGTVTCPPCPGQADAGAGGGAPRGYWEWLQSQNPTPPGAVPCQCPPKGGGAAKFYRPPSYWEWLLGTSRPAEYVRADKFYAAMTALKQSIERLTVRQNVLYEYARCACPARGECGAALAPVLELMFADNKNVTGEMIKDMLAERRSSLIDTLFGWIPNFSGLISFNPFSVLADLLNPTYAGAASYSTDSGHSGTYTVSSGRPGTEHYVVHHPGGGTSHVSTSTGPGATSVSVVTTDQKKETDEGPSDGRMSEESPHSVKKDNRKPQVGEKMSNTDAKSEYKHEPLVDSRPPSERQMIDLGHTVYGPQEQANIHDVIQSSPLGSKTPDVQLSRASPEATSVPGQARQLYSGPGMVFPALANQYTGFNPAGFGGVQPGIAAAGVGVNQGLAAAQYTAG